MTQKAQGQMTRLRVFRFLKQHMLATGDCPTAKLVGAAIGIDSSWAAVVMRELKGADGLPVPITEGETRRQEGVAKSVEVRTEEHELDLVEIFQTVGCE